MSRSRLKSPVVWLFWAGAAFGAILPGLVVDPAAIIDRVMPVSERSLQVPENIEFGDLHPSEKRTASLQIRNVSWRAIQLQPIKADCGCLVIQDAPAQIRARGSAVVTVSIIGSSNPGDFSRTLLVQPLGAEKPKWMVLATGRVTTNVWAEPSELNLVPGDELANEAELKIRHEKGLEVTRVVPTSPAIEVVRSRTQDAEPKYRVRLKTLDKQAARSGNEFIDVYVRKDTDRASLRIPVRWAPSPRVAYLPKRLELPAFGEEVRDEGSMRRVLAIVVPPDCSADETHLEVLVPWVRIGQRSVKGSVLRVELEFLGEQMPAHFKQDILAARLPGDELAQTLAASGDRS